MAKNKIHSLNEQDNLVLKDTKQEEEKVVEQQNIDIPEPDIDIKLEATKKKRIRIDGDNDRVLELNLADMAIISRLNDLYPKLMKLSEEASVKKLDSQEITDDNVLEVLSEALEDIDAKMRKIVDEIFDADVSRVCVPEGTMFDPFNGEFRFEHIISVLVKLYGDNIRKEFNTMSLRMKNHTSKYIGRR